MKYEDFMELLKYRRSIRKFKPDPIPDEYITKILDAARYAMSGANSQPWQFIVIKDPEVKEKVYKAYLECHDFCYHMEQQRIQEYRDAAVYIAVLQDRRKQWGSVLVANQSGRVFPLTMGHCSMVIHLAAAALGLGSQRVDFSFQQPFREILGYPEPVELDVIIPIGYRAYEPGPPHRLPLDELVHYDKYDMRKHMHNEDFLQYLKRIRKLGRPGYRVAIGEDKG
jgi:nitroreductase